MKLRLVLLDRDGVINVDRPDSVKSIDECVMIKGSAQAIARLNQAGIPVCVVTNQSVVGRGIISASQLDAIHEYIKHQLAQSGAHLDGILACFDTPENPTHRRKPGAGMLIEAMQMFGAAPHETLMIGDAITDMQAAASAGCARALVRTGKGASVEQQGVSQMFAPLAVFDDLAEAVDHYLQSANASR